MLALSSRTKAILIALAIFVLGMFCGSVGERWMGRHLGPPGGGRFSRWGPPPRGERGGPPSGRKMLGRLSHELDLSEEQREKIESILKKIRDQMRNVHQDVEKTMKPILEKSKAEIREILTPEQREAYDKFNEKMDRNRRGRGRGRRPLAP
jgi:protein CpxP